MRSIYRLMNVLFAVILITLLAAGAVVGISCYGKISQQAGDIVRISTERDGLQTKSVELEAANAALNRELDALKAERRYVAPEMSCSGLEAITVLQGEIVTVHVKMNSETEMPSIKTELGSPMFIPEEGGYAAYVPVGYAQDPGDYAIDVKAGEHSFTKYVTVTARKYPEQHMTMSSETANATLGTDNANSDYKSKVKPTFKSGDDEKYWDGCFLQPIEGRLTTEFGAYRYTTYTEGGSRTTRHTGIDLAAEEGTPVAASNSGKVVFSGEVIITGNTVVIEHGGGLKTYYYHMSKLNVKKGDMVKKGDIVGKVGTTGYSTGPHLHFEVKIGEYSLDPWTLFDGTSGLYQ